MRSKWALPRNSIASADLAQCQAAGTEESLPSETDEQMACRLLSEDVVEFARSALSPNTLRSYRSSFQKFVAWCDENRTESLPAKPEAVAGFLVSLRKRGLKASSVRAALSGIQYAHYSSGLDSATDTYLVRAVLRGIMRLDTSGISRKNAATAENVAAMLSHTTNDLAGIRDRALILTGFAGALRRSELIGLQVDHLRFVDEGVELFLPTSKTDPFNEGATVAIPEGWNLKPVAALRAWLKLAQIDSGPVFRGVYHNAVLARPLTVLTVSRRLKALAEKAGLDPHSYGSHSLRAGFITSAAERGVGIDQIMRHSRHRSADNMMRYVRAQNRFRSHPGAGFL